MDVLSGRTLLHPTNPAASRTFYRDVLELAVYREFGDAENPGMVFFVGNSLLELTTHGGQPASGVSLWMQVRDLHAEYERLRQHDVPISQAPRLEPWGLWEMWISDPDGVRIILVEIPGDHPLRRDVRSLGLGLGRD